MSPPDARGSVLMYPVADPAGTSALPDDAMFWTPDDEPGESGEAVGSNGPEEGIGFFQDTWRIRDITVSEAADYLDLERRIATAAAAIARTAADYNRLVDAVEAGGVGDPAELLSDAEREVLGDFGWDIPPDLGSLEVGVAGLSYALNAVGIATAASCRGHTGSGAWSVAPVVYFAADRPLAERLQQLVERTGCTLVIDPARTNLIVVRGRTVAHTMALGDTILLHAPSFAFPESRRLRPKNIQDRDPRMSLLRGHDRGTD